MPMKIGVYSSYRQGGYRLSILNDVLDAFMNNRIKEGKVPSSYTGSVGIIGTTNAGNSKLSEEDALSISSVLASTDLISSTIARLPIQIYKQEENGEHVILENDKRAFLINNEPNNVLNGVTLKKRIVLDYLLYGNSYLVPEKVRNEVIGVHHIPPKRINIKKYIDKERPYVTDGIIEVLGSDGRVVSELEPSEMIIILKNSEDGLQSKGVLDLNSQLLELAIKQQQYSSSILENGSLPLAVLETPTKLTEKAMNNLKMSWANSYGGSGNAGKTIVLEEGLNYKPVSLNPNELDLTSTKKATLSDIARIFGIPESMINADANKYNSNEQNNIYFLQYTLSPIISAIEIALEKGLLLEDEKKKGYHVRFDTSSILATTEKEKVESTIQALKGGLLSMNEARERHNLKEIPDDYMMLSLGSIFYDKVTSKMIIPNMGAIIDPNDPDSLAKALGKTDSVQGGKPVTVSDDTNNDALDNKEKQEGEGKDNAED